MTSAANAHASPDHGGLGVRRYSVAVFLACLTGMLIAAPFLDAYEWGAVAESALMTVVLLSAVRAVGARRRTLALAALLVIPAVFGKWIVHLAPGAAAPHLFNLGGLLFCCFIVFHLTRFMMVAPRVDSEVLCAGVATYLMLALVWALAYRVLIGLDPDAIAFTAGPPAVRRLTNFNSLYFSFTTFSTGGFGDILPVSGAARLLAMAQQTVGIFYMAMLISRLVGLYQSNRAAAR